MAGDVPLHHGCGTPQCCARRGTRGAAAPSCLGEQAVLGEPLCPKATLSRWVCFACVISVQNPVFKPSQANTPWTGSGVTGESAQDRGEGHSHLPLKPSGKLTVLHPWPSQHGIEMPLTEYFGTQRLPPLHSASRSNMPGMQGAP